MKKLLTFSGALGLTVALVVTGATPALAVSQAKSYKLPASQGTLISNTWRQNGYDASGNTAQWDYQVSAVYSGSKAVERIRSTWTGSASLRNGGSLSLGLSKGGVTVGASSSWQYVSQTGYWQNSNGAKSSSWRSNFIVAPRVDYRSDTVSIMNTALVKLKSSAQTYSISSGV
jgi:hypothetical protein